MGRLSVTPRPVRPRDSPNISTKKATSVKDSLLRAPRGGKQLGTPSQRRPFQFKPLRESPYKRPDFGAKSNLHTIDEAIFEEDGHPSTTKNIRFDLHSLNKLDSAGDTTMKDLSFCDLSDKEMAESSDGSDFEGWDDETTLVAKFQDGNGNDPEEVSLAELAHKLEGPMQANSDRLKQYLAHTLAPAARKVKEVHKAEEEKVDVGFGIGVLSFDDACKKMEQVSLHDEEDIKRAYMQAQLKIQDYLRQIKEAYEEREKLWDDFQLSVEKITEKARSSFSTTHTEIDEIAAAVDKKSKELAKSSAKDNKAKLLRDLLADMQD